MLRIGEGELPCTLKRYFKKLTPITLVTQYLRKIPDVSYFMKHLRTFSLQFLTIIVSFFLFCAAINISNRKDSVKKSSKRVEN